MFSPFLGVFGTWVALVGMCQAGNFQHSNLSPLSIVYTVYPYYNSDTLLGVFKAEEPFQLSSNVVPLGEEETRDPGNVGSRDESARDSNDSSSNGSNGSPNHRAEQPTEITYWPPVQRGAKPRLGRATTGLGHADLKNGL